MSRKDLLWLALYFYFVITVSEGWRPYRIEITKLSAKSFVNFVEMNASISTSGSMSIYANLLQDISSDMYAHAECFMQSSTGNYDLELVNKTINACEFFKNQKYEPILQVLYKSFTKTGSFPKSCPIKKRLYFIKDVLIDPEAFPPVFPTKKGYCNITLLDKNRTKLRSLGGYTMYAQVIQLGKTY